MRSDQVLKRIRRTGWISDAAAWPDIGDQDLLDEFNDRYLALMTDEIVEARAGYGLKKFPIVCTAGVARYPVPGRTIGGGWDALQISTTSATTFEPLDRIEARDVWMYSSAVSPGMPQRYCVQDDNIEIYPPPVSNFTLLYWYYQCPSDLVFQQSSTDNGGVVRGLISALNKTARTFTAIVPFDMSLTVPAAITTAVQLVDIVRGSGNFPTVAYSLTQSFTGSAWTIGGTQSLEDVQNGDWVRMVGQTDWPMNTSKEHHRMLCDRAAMEILREIGTPEDAAALALTVGADQQRFRGIRRPQVKNAPKMIPCRSVLTRGKRRGGLYS